MNLIFSIYRSEEKRKKEKEEKKLQNELAFKKWCELKEIQRHLDKQKMDEQNKKCNEVSYAFNLTFRMITKKFNNHNLPMLVFNKFRWIEAIIQ
jgi:hypothetical protein